MFSHSETRLLAGSFHARRLALVEREAQARKIAREAPVPRRRNVFAGARINRQTADWVEAAMRSAMLDIRGDYLRLKARGRDLVRNNPYAKRYCGLVQENVIGDTGIRYRPTVLKRAGVYDRELNAYLREEWEEWCEADTATVDGRSSFLQLTQEIARTIPMDGEAIIRMVRGFDNPYSFSLQWIDSDQLDHTFNREPDRNGDGAIRMGVEMDRWGRPIGYWMWEGHPSEPNRGNRIRVPASEIRHLYVPLRRNAPRGITWFHPIMIAIRLLNGYEEAELTAARIGACKMGFFKRTGEGGADIDDLNDDGAGRERIRMEAEPGLLEELDPDLDFVDWDPKHPTQAFGQFVKTNQRSIATGLGCSYNTLFNDLEGVNYSSIRSGTLSERDGWRILHGWKTTQFHKPVHRDWLRMGMLSGRLRLKASDEVRLKRADWRARGFPWVDPQNDVVAFGGELALGINSRSRAASERGRDFEDIAQEIAHENEIAEEHGIVLSNGDPKMLPAPRAEDAAPNAATSAQPEPEDDEDAEENRSARSRIRALR